MKTIKKFSIALVTLVTLSFSFSSCDALTDALSKEVEIEGPAINFSVGENTPVGVISQQKVTEVAEEIEWINESVNIKTKLEEELAKNSFTIDNVKTLLVTESTISLIVPATNNYDFGMIKLYLDSVPVASGLFIVTPLLSDVKLTYTEPYSIFTALEKGNVQLKVTSDKSKPKVKYEMKLVNKYKTKISLF